MKTYAKYLAGAVALAAAGFLLAVGLISVLFKAKTGTFAPSTSADAASWVQAIGSIAAILSAYHLGGKQASEARRQADRQAFERESRREAILVLVETTCDRIVQTAIKVLEREPGEVWAVVLPICIAETSSGLDTLRGIPHAEFDPPASVKHVSEIRAATQRLLADQQACMEVVEAHVKALAIDDYIKRMVSVDKSQQALKAACDLLQLKTHHIASTISRERQALRATNRQQTNRER
ncbi:hypothetical protein [Achromobacter ruhlandii]|uniref:hypothetical protein n=1 Tax=Achromobacter ruhlandii TaxID=72557 RepID=UPI003B993104